MALQADTTIPDGHCLGLFCIYNNFFHNKKKVFTIIFVTFLCIGAHALGFVG
jgi:hypothetical protein